LIVAISKFPNKHTVTKDNGVTGKKAALVHNRIRTDWKMGVVAEGAVVDGSRKVERFGQIHRALAWFG